jgi:Glycosyltransferase
MSAKISIIIPVYNDELFLEQTINSCVSQTLRDIEIILIDDGSTDGSAAILDAWKQKDERISVYSLADNAGPWDARNLGVEHSTGEYIMFCDSDDELSLDACEILYAEMKKKPADILHFNTEIVNCNNTPEEKIEALRKYVRPRKGTIKGKDIILACFRDGTYRWNLCNKLFHAELCRKVLTGQPKMRLTFAEDALAYFLIAFHADSYHGYDSRELYRYHYGRGGSGQTTMSAMQFAEVCDSALIAKRMRACLEEAGADAELYEAVRKFETIHLNICVNDYQTQVDEADKTECFDILLDAWPVADVATKLASSKRTDAYRLAKQIRFSKHMQVTRKPVKTIGTYYFSVANGGTERVMSRLCYLWREMGYEVVLITEDLGQKDEYDFPEGIRRVYLPDRKKSEGAEYRERGEILERSIRENGIDVVVYHAWTSPLAFWDEMVIKSCGAAFVFHCHNIFTMSLLFARFDLKELATAPALADAVITLSEVDKTFWQNFNNNVFQVNNPFTGNFDDWSTSDCSGHDILWLARIAPEKRPYDALGILQGVLRTVPDAKLHIVGAGWDKNFDKQFRKTIKEKNLTDNVVMYGYQSNVMPFYQKASVFLMTSEFEGYPMTLQESMAAGLPIVMYDLPHLTVTKNNPGMIIVEQQNINGAARAIAELLSDDDRRKAMGKESRRYIDGLMKYDYVGTWTGIINSLGEEHQPVVPEAERRMMETLICHHHDGVAKRFGAIRYAERKTVRRAVNLVRTKDLIHERGLKYTLKKAKNKLFD